MEMDEAQRDSVAATGNDDDVKVTSESHVLQPTGDLDVSTAESLTLPRIEQVLRSEGVQPLSITEQIDSLRKKVARYTSHHSLQLIATICCSNDQRVQCDQCDQCDQRAQCDHCDQCK